MSFTFQVTCTYTDEPSITVKFMRATNQGSYTWPDVDDVSIIHEHEVVEVLATPNVIKRGRGVEYVFQ